MTVISGFTFCFNNPSIPPLRVLVEEGQPLHAPFKSTQTILSL